MVITILQLTEHHHTHQLSPPPSLSPPPPSLHHPLPTKWMGWSPLLFVKPLLTTKYADRHHAQNSMGSISLNLDHNPLRQGLFSSSFRMRKQRPGNLNDIAQSHTADICIRQESPGSFREACAELHLEKLTVNDRRVRSVYSNFRCSCNLKDSVTQLSNIPSHQTQPPNSEVPSSRCKQ